MSADNPTPSMPMDIEAITALLPHRYPFLLIDRVVEFEYGRRAVAIKNVTVNEQYFQGHFPGHPVMPGVLIVEAMAQTAGVLTLLSSPRDAEHSTIFYLVKVDKARFNRIVVPGDRLHLEVEHKRAMRNMRQFLCRALVEDKVAAEAELLCAAVAR